MRQEHRAPLPTVRERSQSETAKKVLSVALESFATRGYAASSLDQIAASLGIRKQSVLYWYSSKDELLNAVIAHVVSELTTALTQAIEVPNAWERIDRVVRAMFRFAVRRPELLEFLREAERLDGDASRRLRNGFAPLVERATHSLDRDMQNGTFRKYDSRFFLLSAYAVVVGVATSTETREALGMPMSLRALVHQRNDVIKLLRLALVP